MKKTMVFIVFVCLYVPNLHSGEIGFDEAFSLDGNRAAALRQLIPGTEDYYYYHCLHYQHTGDFKKLHDLLNQWIKRHRHTARVEEIRNRELLRG